MKINIDIDAKLMLNALRSSGLSSPKEAVEEGLKLLLRHSQEQCRNLRGQVKWEGDLNEMRGGN